MATTAAVEWRITVAGTDAFGVVRRQRSVVSFGQPMEGLARQEFLSDLALELAAAAGIGSPEAKANGDVPRTNRLTPR